MTISTIARESAITVRIHAMSYLGAVIYDLKFLSMEFYETKR